MVKLTFRLALGHGGGLSIREINYFGVAPLQRNRSVPIPSPKMQMGTIKKVLDFIPIFLFFLEFCNIEKFVPRNPLRSV